MQDVEVIGALVRQANDNLAAAGVRCQTRWVNGRAEARYLVPLRDGRFVAFTGDARPEIVVGGKIGRKIKTGLKKVAKSKAFGKLLKAGAAIASVVPGGQALGAGLAAAATVQSKVAKAAGKAKKAAKGAKAALAPAKKPAAKPAAAKAAKGKPAAPAKRPTAAAARAPAGSTPAQRGTRVQLPSGRIALVSWVN